MFSTLLEISLPFSSNLKLSSAKSFSLEESKILLFGKGLKTQWKEEKLLIMSNFSFSDSVFKRLVRQTRKNQGLFGKGLSGERSRSPDTIPHGQRQQCISGGLSLVIRILLPSTCSSNL